MGIIAIHFNETVFPLQKLTAVMTIPDFSIIVQPPNWRHLECPRFSDTVLRSRGDLFLHLLNLYPAFLPELQCKTSVTPSNIISELEMTDVGFFWTIGLSIPQMRLRYSEKYSVKSCLSHLSSEPLEYGSFKIKVLFTVPQELRTI